MIEHRFTHVLSNQSERFVGPGPAFATLLLTVLIFGFTLAGIAGFSRLYSHLVQAGAIGAGMHAREALFVLFTLVLGFGTGFLALIIVRAKVDRAPLRTLFSGAPKFRFGLLAVSFALVVAVAAVAGFWLDADLRNTALERVGSHGPAQFLMLLAIYLFGFSIQSTFEEAFVRGWLIQRLSAHGLAVWLSAGLSTLVFALMHFSGDLQPAYLGLVAVMGLAFAWSAIRLNGLEFSIGAHVGNNFVVGGLFGGLISGSGFEDQDGALISGIVYLVGFGLVVEGFARFWPGRSGLEGLPRRTAG